MQARQIAGLSVSAVGLGAMPMSLEGRPDETQSLRTIHAALDAGVRLIDTADSYCIELSETGHNERLVAKALASWSWDPDGVLVATKAGHYRPGDGSWQVDGRPEHLKRACEASLKALDVEAIGLFQFHRPDPNVPYEESLGALAELLAEGKIRLAGISNATVAQIETAARILPLASVQNQFSPLFRSSADELARCTELGVAFLAWAPLGGAGQVKDLSSRAPVFGEVAAERGVSAQQVALAWELAQGPNVITIPGSTRPETILDSVQAAELQLTAQEFARLQAKA